MKLPLIAALLALTVNASAECYGDCSEERPGFWKGIDMRSRAAKDYEAYLQNGGDPFYSTNVTTTSNIQVKEFDKSDNGEFLPRTGKTRFVPFDFNGSDMAKVAAAAGAAVVFFANDQEMMNFVQENKSSLSEKIAYLGEGVGSEWPAYAAAGGYILGVISGNDGAKRYAVMGAKTMLIAGLTTQVLKRVFHRSRPNEHVGPYEFRGPSPDGENISFPSGHTTSAFAVATFIAETNKDTPMIPILAYSAAAVAGWSRVHDEAHWFSDVAVGALVGHLVAKAVLKTETAKKGFLITPGLNEFGDFEVQFRYAPRPESSVKGCGKNLEGRERIRACIQAAFEASNN